MREGDSQSTIENPPPDPASAGAGITNPPPAPAGAGPGPGLTNPPVDFVGTASATPEAAFGPADMESGLTNPPVAFSFAGADAANPPAETAGPKRTMRQTRQPAATRKATPSRAKGRKSRRKAGARAKT
jgi:hypothetical protein